MSQTLSHGILTGFLVAMNPKRRKKKTKKTVMGKAERKKKARRLNKG